MPPSSLYCCHRSVSRISSADRKRRIAASLEEMLATAPAARAGAENPITRPAAVAATPSAAPRSKKERRLVNRCSVSIIRPLFELVREHDQDPAPKDHGLTPGL